MADRTVKVNLLANVVQYERSVDNAADATDRLREKAERFDGKNYKANLELDTKNAEKDLAKQEALAKKYMKALEAENAKSENAKRAELEATSKAAIKTLSDRLAQEKAAQEQAAKDLEERQAYYMATWAQQQKEGFEERKKLRKAEADAYAEEAKREKALAAERAKVDKAEITAAEAKAKKLSDAAYKGWETRRKQAAEAAAELARIQKEITDAENDAYAERDARADKFAADELARHKHAAEVMRYEIGQGIAAQKEADDARAAAGREAIAAAKERAKVLREERKAQATADAASLKHEQGLFKLEKDRAAAAVKAKKDELNLQREYRKEEEAANKAVAAAEKARGDAEAARRKELAKAETEAYKLERERIKELEAAGAAAAKAEAEDRKAAEKAKSDAAKARIAEIKKAEKDAYAEEKDRDDKRKAAIQERVDAEKAALKEIADARNEAYREEKDRQDRANAAAKAVEDQLKFIEAIQKAERRAYEEDEKRAKAKIALAEKAAKELQRIADKAQRDMDKLHGEAIREYEKELKAKEKAYKDHLKQIEAHNKAFEKASKQDDNDKTQTIGVGLDVSAGERELKRLAADFAKFDHSKASPEVNLNVAEFKLKARALENEMIRLSKMNVTPEVALKADKLYLDILKLQGALNKLEQENIRIKVQADTGDALQKLMYLKLDIDKLNMQKASPEANLKIEKFRAQIAVVEAELRRLGRMEASADVDVKTANAMIKIAEINAELRNFNGKTFTAKMDVNTGNSRSRIGMIIAAIAAATPVISALGVTGGAAILGLSGTLGIMAAGAGVAALAFSGMGQAMEATNDYAIDPSKKNLTRLTNSIKLLNDAQREFYYLIQNQMKPALEELQKSAAKGMLPGVTQGLREILQIMPLITGTVGKVADAMGELSRATGDALNNGVWQNYIAFLGNEARPQLLDLGAAFGKTVEGIVAMQMAFNPFTRDILSGLRDMATEFSNWAQSLKGTKEFEDFLNYVRTVGPQVMETFGALIGAIGALIVAGMPLAPVFLQLITTFANFVSAVAGIPFVGTTLIGLAAALGTLNLAMKAGAGLSAAASTMAGRFGLMGASAATAGAQVGAAGAASAGAAGGIGAAAGAATRGSGAMNALKTAGGAVLRNLPLIGVAAFALAAAYDQMNLSTSEGAEALTDSGFAAAGVRAELEKNSQTQREYTASMGETMGGIREWMTGMLGTETTTEQATAALEEQIAVMTPLQASYARMQQAQNVLNDAIQKYGPGSRQAIDAMNQLNAATAKNTIQNELAGLAGGAYYDKLKMLTAQAGPAGDAARQLAAGLSMAEISSMGATVKIDNLGRAIATLPDGKQIMMNVDGKNAITQLQAVSTSLDKIPPGKSVNVGVLGEQAKKMLSEIGITVKTLPNGEVVVTAKDAQAKATLMAFMQYAEAVKVNPKIAADPTLARQTMFDFINQANAAVGKPQLIPYTAEADRVVTEAMNRYNAMKAVPEVRPNMAPADAASAAWRDQTAGMTPRPVVDALTGPADDRSRQWNATTAGLRPVPIVNGNTGPASDASRGWAADTQGLRPVPNVDANVRRAQDQARDWERQTGALTPTPRVFADTGNADRQVSGFWNSWAGRVLTWFVNVITPNASGSITQPMAEGGIVANAAGNHLSPEGKYNREYQGHKLRTMQGGGARMVPPNSWRVVGDRMDVPELYAPLDGSGRSEQLIAQGAATFGKTLVDSKILKALGADTGRMASIPQSVNMPREMAMAGGGSSNHTVTNLVTVNNPIAERTSDSVQMELARLANLGLFGGE